MVGHVSGKTTPRVWATRPSKKPDQRVLDGLGRLYAHRAIVSDQRPRSHKCRQMQGLAWRNPNGTSVGARDPGLRTDRDRATGTGFDAWCLHQAPNERARRSDAGRH